MGWGQGGGQEQIGFEGVRSVVCHSFSLHIALV